MFFAISASQRPWISLVFAVLGVVCEVTGHHDVAVSLITASITIATLAEKNEGGTTVTRELAAPPVPLPRAVAATETDKATEK